MIPLESTYSPTRPGGVTTEPLATGRAELQKEV